MLPYCSLLISSTFHGKNRFMNSVSIVSIYEHGSSYRVRCRTFRYYTLLHVVCPLLGSVCHTKSTPTSFRLVVQSHHLPHVPLLGQYFTALVSVSCLAYPCFPQNSSWPSVAMYSPPASQLTFLPLILLFWQTLVHQQVFLHPSLRRSGRSLRFAQLYPVSVS
jgi:hypothetical protein